MKRFLRRSGTPTWVRDALPRGERALASAATQGSAWLVGTRAGLVHVSRFPPEGIGVAWLPWEQVLRADWDDETSTLSVEEVRDFGEPVAVRRYVLDEAGLLLQLVRERVTASVVHLRRVELGKRRGLTVVGRRPPTGGAVSWAVQLDPGANPDDTELLEAANVALREAQESIGEG